MSVGSWPTTPERDAEHRARPFPTPENSRRSRRAALNSCTMRVSAQRRWRRRSARPAHTEISN